MTRIAILGATGYTALELIKILLRHPEAEIVAVTSRQEGQPHIAMIHPALTGRVDLRLEDLSPAEVAARADCVFSCLPHGASAAVIPALLDAGRRVVDFSADYRLNDAEVYAQWYGQKHADPARLGKVVYGLPELFRKDIPPAQLVANPGCYPTSAILALAPLLKAGMIDPKTIIVDSKSGVSGAGRTLKLTTHYPECNESISAYNVGRHRHQPEIDQILEHGGGRDGRSRLHAPPGADGSRHPFHDVLAADLGRARRNGVADDSRFLCRRAVCARRRSFSGHEGLDGHELLRHHGPRRPRPRADVQLPRQPDKGRSGAAVQNFNLMYGYAETTAL